MKIQPLQCKHSWETSGCPYCTIERLTAERDELLAERQAHTDKVALYMRECTRLEAERDAAFSMSRCECGIEEACANLVRLAAERDAALAASRHETDLRQQALEEIENLQKQITEMREIGKLAFRAIVSASDVIFTIIPENDDEAEPISALQNQLHDVGMSLFTVCRLPHEYAQWIMERKRV